MRQSITFVGAVITFLAFIVSLVGAMFMIFSDSYQAGVWGVSLFFFGISLGFCGLAIALFGIALDESPMSLWVPIQSQMQQVYPQQPPPEHRASHMTCVECYREIPSDAIICPYCRHEYEKLG